MGSALGISTPLTYPTQTLQALYGQPLTSLASMNTGLSTNPFATQQQLLQLLQVVPQQLQHLQQIEYQQQQQIQQIQQVLQVIPIQIAQLQQVIQIALQQIQQQQPLGQLSGATGLGVAPPWGIAPQFFGAQSGQQVM
jgi:hypothetical protein